jgi:TonB family protein
MQASRVGLVAGLAANNPELAPFRDEIDRFMAQHMTWADLRPLLAAWYADALSESDLRETAAFARSPLGRRFFALAHEVSLQAADGSMSADTMRAVAMRRFAAELERRLAPAEQREVAAFVQSPAGRRFAARQALLPAWTARTAEELVKPHLPALRAALTARRRADLAAARPDTARPPVADFAGSGAAPRDGERDTAYFEFQVDRPVRLLAGGAPAYPAMLQSTGVQGQVIAQYVVDTLGRAEAASFRVLESTHVLFTSAVQAALPALRFVPAEVGGRKVRQLVQQPFVFSIEAPAPPPADQARPRATPPPPAQPEVSPARSP